MDHPKDHSLFGPGLPGFPKPRAEAPCRICRRSDRIALGTPLQGYPQKATEVFTEDFFSGS